MVRGEWGEVKTLVIGEVGEATERDGEQVVQTDHLSYFSRLTDAESFQRLTLAELYRRGVETAEQLAVVGDGAEWIQGFADFHCPEATRILDFPHAGGRICQVGAAVLGEGHASLPAWQTRQLHQLKHQGPEGVLPTLRTFAVEQLNVPLVAENLAYLEKRVAQMQYPTFQEAGWPIGSGIAESANKLVVEARLKGAGMHWARASVNPMLALRNAVCNDRWDEAWAVSAEQIRRVGLVRRAIQPKQVRVPEPLASTPSATPPPVRDPVADGATRRKPAADHPWRRTYQATKARMAQAASQAKL